MSTPGLAQTRKLLRSNNKVKVLDFVRLSKGCSRSDVARALSLSRSAVSAIVNQLLEEGWLVETGEGQSIGGRKPIQLSLNAQAGFALGIDIGATHLIVRLADLTSAPVIDKEVPFDVAIGPEKSLEQVLQLARSVIDESGYKQDQLVGVAVGVPGPMDSKRGTIIAPPIMPGWNEFPVRDYLQKEFSARLYMENDANLGALGEVTYGAGRNVDNLVYIKVATGIGSGIIVNGEIYHGQTGAAGEIGHTNIVENGPPCSCGSYGCLEAMAGGPAILRRARMALDAGQQSLLTSHNNGKDPLSLESLIDAAEQGDSLSRYVLRDAGKLLGVAISDMINLLNPGLVIVGGSVAEAGGLILDPLRNTVANRSLPAAWSHGKIKLSELGNHASIAGAIALVLQQAFSSPEEHLW